jgi:hypothetical protein
MEIKMQFSIKKSLLTFTTAAFLAVSFSSVYAAPKGKTYSEDEFLNTFSGKSKKVITDKLGEPFKKRAFSEAFRRIKHDDESWGR